jgi:hypothetical protein
MVIVFVNRKYLNSVAYKLPDDNINMEVLAMLRKKFNISDKGKSLLTLLISAFVFFLLAGCATTGMYGTVDRDYDLDERFRNYEVLQEYTYYESGGYRAPNAILLIHKDYELDNSAQLWRPVPDIDSYKMKYWLSAIHNERYLNKPSRYYAAYILDPNGQRAGVWYSFEPLATAKFLEGNKVVVYTPDPFKRYFY